MDKNLNSGQTNTGGHYYPELDSLRFFAFLSVLIHHAPYAKSIALWAIIKSYGWIGVDLFLCLSAFLFAKLLFVEYQQKGNINIRHFYLRRALRIWPLYLIFTSILVAGFVLMNDWSGMLVVRIFGLLTFTDNLLTMLLGYNNVIPYVAHLWTISYEEQFYLAIPWSLRFLYRQKSSTSLVILGGFMLLGMASRAVLIDQQAHYLKIWVFPLTHFESILGGLMIGLGLLAPILKRVPSWSLLVVGLLALWLVTLLPNVNETQWLLMLTYPLVGIGVSLILSSVMQGETGLVSTLMRNRTLGYLGKISYGLYVYHIAGIAVARTIVDAILAPAQYPIVSPALVLATAFTLTVLISALSYQFLEKPFLKMKAHFTFVTSRPV